MCAYRPLGTWSCLVCSYSIFSLLRSPLFRRVPHADLSIFGKILTNYVTNHKIHVENFQEHHFLRINKITPGQIIPTPRRITSHTFTGPKGYDAMQACLITKIQQFLGNTSKEIFNQWPVKDSSQKWWSWVSRVRRATHALAPPQLPIPYIRLIGCIGSLGGIAFTCCTGVIASATMP